MTRQNKKRALISVSDKTGLVAFAKELLGFGYEIISTGGTLKTLLENHVAATAVEKVTGFPEMLDGRVKTLHPKIHGGLLALRENAEHMATAAEHGIGMIDLVVVNLYPFQSTVAKKGVSVEEAIENIDIGGPSMIRSASKNYRSVGVVVRPERYAQVLENMRKNHGHLDDALRADLAAEAFRHCSSYDATIAQYFDQKVLAKKESVFPDVCAPVLSKVMDLRYGENPHQKAAFFKLEGMHGLPSLIQRHGKELSFNNLVDIEAAWAIVRELELCGAVIIKHTNPCGAAVSETISSAYKRAHDADAVSAFGSVVGLNRRVDRQTAEQIASTFVEVVVAPGFDADALQILGQKAAIRLVEIPEFNPGSEEFVFKYVSGGFLLQTPDDRKIAAQDFNVVTKRKPTEREINDLVFAFRLVKFIKSNAILIAKDGQSLGVGAGQMSRVEAVELAIKKAGARTEGAVLASDAFFPFKDSVELAANANIKAIVQPGGSKRDQESIDCCDAHGIAMVFTSVRHFRH